MITSHSGVVSRKSKYPVRLTDENATFNDEGTSTSGWTATNSTASIVESTYIRQTKGPTAGSSSSIQSTMSSFPGTNLDYIIYGKARSSTGANHIGVIWILNGSKEVSIWFGSSTADTAYAGGAVSICGTTGASTRNVAAVASGMAYNTTPIEFALHVDKKFSTLNCYFKENGIWILKGRVACDWFSSSSIAVLNTTNSPNGAYTEVDYLTVCSPNIMSIGDSICEGKTLFSPDRTLTLNNYLSNYLAYFAPYGASLRNNLVVNKGVGSQTSAQIASRVVADVTSHLPRLVFLHASSNDENAVISQATRTTNIQNTINSINSAGAKCILLNAMYGTDAGADNTPTNDLQLYMTDWWDNYRPTLTGVYAALNIMVPVNSGGFQDPALTQADGIHPTVSGYQQIGQFLAKS